MDDAQVSVAPPEVPLLRGVLHTIFAPVTLFSGAVLAWMAPSPRAALAVFVMAAGFAAIFGMSSVYHRIARHWSPTARRRARQADHAMIFLGMATSYTSVWLVALDGWVSDALLVYAWIAATIGVISKIWFLDARPTRHLAVYLGMGLVGLIVVPSLINTMGATSVALILVGSVIITLGGIVFAYQRPNPIPRWFGHHEIFHAGTVVGCALFLAGLATFVLR
ncbi:MAG: hemolysin III family protein [Thermoleophilia bacterium]|nr:hemolysin III family protein [Thermoleophilia bacterium]